MSHQSLTYHHLSNSTFWINFSKILPDCTSPSNIVISKSLFQFVFLQHSGSHILINQHIFTKQRDESFPICRMNDRSEFYFKLLFDLINIALDLTLLFLIVALEFSVIYHPKLIQHNQWIFKILEVKAHLMIIS